LLFSQTLHAGPLDRDCLEFDREISPR